MNLCGGSATDWTTGNVKFLTKTGQKYKRVVQGWTGLSFCRKFTHATITKFSLSHWAHTFLENKYLWITIQTLAACMAVLDATSCTVFLPFTKISFSMWWMFTTYTAAGWMWVCGRFETFYSHQKSYCTNHRHIHMTGSLLHLCS
jgi:hypothetical protein